MNEAITPDFIAREIARAKTYYLVLLSAGPVERADEMLLAELQQKHLQYLFGLRAQGRLVLHGPLLDDGRLRGICIFDAPHIEEVQALMQSDPLVETGFLSAEVHAWMGLPGAMLP